MFDINVFSSFRNINIIIRSIINTPNKFCLQSLRYLTWPDLALTSLLTYAPNLTLINLNQLMLGEGTAGLGCTILANKLMRVFGLKCPQDPDTFLLNLLS